MGYPDLKSDEAIVLTAQHVKVKSVPFELVLTNRRLIIIDSEKNVVPTQQISLVTIRNVAAGENAIRDPVITLTILTDTADTREMALTFVRQTAGERRRESDEWVRALRKNIAEAVAHPVEPAAEAPNADARAESAGAAGGIKKKIETARPIKKIVVDTSHLPPKPVETTSLPEGSFCGRCGNRIPPGSTFCNRCGTKVAAPGEESGIPPVTLQQVASPVPTMGTGERKGRPLEQIIHSIEPLIEDSVPRTETPPPVPEPAAVPSPEPASMPEPATTETPAEAITTETPATSPAPEAEPAKETPEVTVIPPVPPIPPVPEMPKKKNRNVAIAAVLVIIILAVIGGGYLAMKSMQSHTVVPQPTTPVPTPVTTIPTPTPAPTPVPTTASVTPQGTPQVLIPQNGVWAEISYDQTYSGLVGVPGMQAGVSDTGDHFYRIPTVDGTVSISVQKNDGSGDELKVIVYDNGIAVRTESTTRPDGSIDLTFPLTTPTPTPTPTVIATTSAASNMTVNTTA